LAPVSISVLTSVPKFFNVPVIFLVPVFFTPSRTTTYPFPESAAAVIETIPPLTSQTLTPECGRPFGTPPVCY